MTTWSLSCIWNLATVSHVVYRQREFRVRGRPIESREKMIAVWPQQKVAKPAGVSRQMAVRFWVPGVGMPSLHDPSREEGSKPDARPLNCEYA